MVLLNKDGIFWYTVVFTVHTALIRVSSRHDLSLAMYFSIYRMGYTTVSGHIVPFTKSLCILAAETLTAILGSRPLSGSSEKIYDQFGFMSQFALLVNSYTCEIDQPNKNVLRIYYGKYRGSCCCSEYIRAVIAVNCRVLVLLRIPRRYSHLLQKKYPRHVGKGRKPHVRSICEGFTDYRYVGEVVEINRVCGDLRAFERIFCYWYLNTSFEFLERLCTRGSLDCRLQLRFLCRKRVFRDLWVQYCLWEGWKERVGHQRLCLDGRR